MLIKDKYKCENCGGNDLSCAVNIFVDLSDLPIDGIQVKDYINNVLSNIRANDDYMEFFCSNCGHPYMEGEISDLMEALNCEE